MRRIIPVIAAIVLILSASPALAQNQQILDALRTLNNMPERFSTPAQAEATAKAFFETVQSSSGNENAIEVLKQIKRGVPQAEWNENCRRAENLLMHTVQQTLDGTIVETIRSRAGNKTLGSIHGYGYSGKWPIKPETQLTFDGDFDASFFGTEIADTNPENRGGIIQDVNGRLKARLGTGPSGLGIVLNGFGWEGRADVYVTSAGKQWAIRQSMTRLYLIDPVTGQPVNITATPGALFAETQVRILNKLHPELFENGRLREGITPEEIRRILAEDPRLGEVWKVWLSGTRYGTGQAAAGVIDFTCHVSEVAEATTTLEQRTKVAKQVARANNVFINAMDGAKLPWREFFSESELRFMSDCATLDRAKITYAEAAEKRVNLLRRLKGRDWSPADIAEYDRLVTESQNAQNALKAAEGRAMSWIGSEAAFMENAVKIMRREAQVAHREFVLDIMGRPPAERSRLLQQYESDLRAILDHYSKKANVPKEAITWANEALESVKELNRIANERAAALEGFGTKFKRIWEMFNEPANTRENVRKFLGETPIGEALLGKIPEWAFASTRPPALTDIAFASPSKLVAETVWTQVNQPVNALMMLDLLWQLTDIWGDDRTTEVQKLTSSGGIVAMLVVPHLYLVPMVYHASLQGDPRQLTYVMACYICPPAMLPMLVESMGGRIVAGAKQALFQSELEAMFQASSFKPEPGTEPKDWAENRDAIRYTWIALNTELDTYGREGERNLAAYIRILASDTRSEIPLSQPKKMSGLQAIYLPGGVAKSFRAMIQDGDHKLFRENAALGNALAELQKFNCDRLVPYMDKPPAYCRYAWAESKSGIRLDLINNMFAEGEEQRLKAEGKSGENIVRIVSAMLAQRAKLQDAVITELAEAIILSFEEEMRARKLVEMGLLDEILKELLAIGEELGIKEELLSAFQDALRQQEGVKVSTDELKKPEGPESRTAKTKEQIAKLADTWLKSYRQVSTTRRFLVGLAGGYGVPDSDLGRFMHGKPPLAVEPAKDSEIARVSQEVVMSASRDVSTILFNFKGQSRSPHPLDPEAEGILLQYLYTARIIELTSGITYGMVPLWIEGPKEKETASAFGERARAELKRQLDMKNKTPFGSPPDFTAVLDRYQTLARGYAEKFAALREAYSGAIQISVEGPAEAEAMKDVTLKILAKRQGKPADDALRDARVEWTVDRTLKNSGTTWWFSPLEETVMNITVTATREVAGKKVVLGSATHRLTVRKPKDDKKDGKTDDKKDAAATAPSCSYEYTDYGECVRATKKQTRTVKAKKPAGCVERQKPDLEKGCNPPPTEEDKRNQYFNCLCRCSSGWAGHIGVWYDPEGKSVPECKSSGPCFGGAGAFGCTRRHFFGGPNDCAKGCWESAFGKGTYDPGKADKLRKDENKKYKKPLTVTIKASKNPADFGDIVDLTAETAEGSGGYKWNWGGCAQDAKDDRAKVLNSRQCKPCTATVTATDQDGDSASASLEVKCTALRVKLTKETPKETTIPIGGKATFLAEVFSGDKPASGSFSYIWERNPDALFGDPKNPTYETKGGSQSRNTATFKKMGATPVWVSVLKEVDGRKMTVGESEQIPIQAVSPKLKLSVNKKEPLIGEKVVITVHEEPAMSNDIITFWWEIKGDAANPGPEPNIPNQRSYSFKPKNVKPVTVTVHAKAKEDGSDLGQADVTVNPKGYTVTIGEPRYLGPKPKIWKCDTQLGGACPGLVDVGDQQFAVHHDVFMKATVNPALSGARYRWAIDPAGTCGTPGAGDEIKMNCSDTGTFTASLKVANSDGDPVGEASRSVTISVSQKDMDGSKKAKEAQEKIQKAKGLVAEGKLDEGIALANEAAGLDPKNAEAKNLSQKWGNEKQTVTQQIDKTKKLITENRFEQAEKEFAPAQKLHPKYPPVVETDKLLKTKKDEYKKNVAGKLAGAKDKARKGDYDGAIKDAEDAAKFDPANKDAAATAQKLRQEKETIHQQIGKAKKLMDENKFADAQKEIVVASNLNGYYQPVQQANQELGTRWNKYNAEVRDKVYEVRSANEKKDFGKALEIAAAWRASTKLDPYAEKELKQQEDWAKQWKAQKDKQIGVLKAAGEKVKSYDYAGALKQYDEGFANGQNIYNGTEPEYKEAVELRSQAFTKNKRLGELIPWVRKAAEDKEYMTADALQNILKTADEAIALQPTNEQLKTWRGQIVARAEKTKADNDRTAAGRKYLDAARSEENTYLSQLSGTQGRQGQWGEKLEGDMQSHIQKAIDNYRESLKYIPDAGVEKKIKELETTLEGRKKYLENYRLSVTLKNEADALSQQATKDPDIRSASPKYDEAIAKYRKSLALYRPNAESVEKAITNLEYYKHERWVKKYWADGQAAEKEGKVVEAIGIYDKAIASFHTTVPQNDRMYIIVHQQDLKNRVTAAKNWRADGEAKQKAGKIAEAIASYKQSLALLPDAALAEHVRMLEGKQAEAGGKKAAADRLWQEGTALFNQGRPSDALMKFKESLGYWSDATRTKYVADMEARRSKAVSLREQGAGLQGQKRIPEAIAKYKESLTYWPDPALTAHIATLEKSRAGDRPPTVVSGGVDGAWEVSFNNYRGKMELQRSSSGWSGRLWLDAHQKWEQLTNISYDPGTGRLEFTRPISGATQRYSGVLSADKLEGTFTQQNSSGKYTWWAKRTAAGTVVTAGSSPTVSSPVTTSAYYHVDLTPYGGKKGIPRKVKNIEVDDGSWIRLKATHEKKLTLDISLPQRVSASAVAVVTNLDNAHNVPDKMTTTVLTVHTTSGDRTFEFKAGVHSSEWNRSETGGATHAWPKETNIGGPRWMAVFSLPAGSVVTGLRFDHRDTDKKYYHGDAAPGFCLRGITLVRSGGAVSEATGVSTTATKTTAATAAINIVGRWKTETIEGGKVDAVSTTVFNRDGSYTMDVSGEELAGVAVCTIRGSYSLSGQTLTLRPSGSQCKFRDGTTRSEPVDKYDTISGRVSGNDRSFTYLPGGNVSVRYTKQ